MISETFYQENKEEVIVVGHKNDEVRHSFRRFFRVGTDNNLQDEGIR